jgi:hypothetical protein
MIAVSSSSSSSTSFPLTCDDEEYLKVEDVGEQVVS